MLIVLAVSRNQEQLFGHINILCKEGASDEERLIGSGMKGQLESN